MHVNYFRACTTLVVCGLLAACGEKALAPSRVVSPPTKPAQSATDPFNDQGNCLAADFKLTTANPDLSDPTKSCTANDIAVATSTLISYSTDGVTYIPYNTGDQVQCNKGDPIFLNLAATLKQTDNSARTDIGVWIGLNGSNARTGTCNHYNLVSPPNIGDDIGGVSNTDGDSCGDMTQASDAPSISLGIITAVCQASTTSDSLHVGSCISWSQTDVACPSTDPAFPGPTGFRVGTLPGTSSKCNCEGFNVPIIVNQTAKLEVVKSCTPSTDPGLFNLQIDAVDKATDAACGGSTGAIEVSAGTNASPGASHDFGETAGTGTSLSDYTSTRSCVNRVGGAVRLASGAGTSGSVTLQPDDDVICTITNTHKATIKIVKDAVPNSAQDFAFTSTIPGNTSFSLDDDADPTLSNTQTMSGLTPGSYTVTEGSTSGWDLTSITCVDATSNSSGNTGTGVASINVAAGETVTCTFKNTQRGSIVIQKVTSPTGLSGSFGFTQNVDGSGAFNLADGGSKTFTNVVPNTTTGYTVTEGSATGFKLTSLSCDNPDGSDASATVLATGVSTIKVDPGETVTCTYTNLQLATLELRKVENGGLPLSRAWSFELRTGASTSAAGTVVASASAVVSTGVVSFSGYFTPGQYQLCETGMPVGYTNNFTGFTPLGATPEGGDNSTECINITLASGANGPSGITGIPNPINNITNPPTGAARTIGYWKNWSSCTGGNQYAKAVARNELNKTLDFYLPLNKPNSIYPFGDIAGPLTCQQAVYLLSKSDMNSGKKMASDPAYNLAAQLLAAKLNLAATGACADAVTAINSAQALLDAINFSGTGTYANKMTSAQKTLALQLATTLDQFNNNILCP